MCSLVTVASQVDVTGVILRREECYYALVDAESSKFLKILAALSMVVHSNYLN